MVRRLRLVWLRNHIHCDTVRAALEIVRSKEILKYNIVRARRGLPGGGVAEELRVVNQIEKAILAAADNPLVRKQSRRGGAKIVVQAVESPSFGSTLCHSPGR